MSSLTPSSTTEANTVSSWIDGWQERRFPSRFVGNAVLPRCPISGVHYTGSGRLPDDARFPFPFLQSLNYSISVISPVSVPLLAFGILPNPINANIADADAKQEGNHKVENFVGLSGLVMKLGRKVENNLGVRRSGVVVVCVILGALLLTHFLPGRSRGRCGSKGRRGDLVYR
jgi:hypothetical protein